MKSGFFALDEEDMELLLIQLVSIAGDIIAEAMKFNQMSINELVRQNKTGIGIEIITP